MTEELEKEAEEKYSEVDREFIACQDEGEVFTIGYILGAEPREKRIAELEQKIESLENNSSLHEGILWNDIHNQDKKIADLKELLSLVYKGLISYKTNPNTLVIECTFEMEKKVFMDWIHRVKPYVTEGEVKK